MVVQLRSEKKSVELTFEHALPSTKQWKQNDSL